MARTINLSKVMIIFVLLCSESDFLFTPGAAADGESIIMCKDTEREALLTFKQGLVLIYGAALLVSWGNEDEKKECCEWEGVLCSNSTGHVIGVELQYFGGEISRSLLELRHLSSLDLSQNDFGGSSIPDFIGSLQNLRNLNLHSCNFSGQVPFQLQNLNSLRTLDLGENHRLTSTNLSWLSSLSLLSQLDLSANQFTGFLPDLKDFSSLRELRLSRNKLTELPTSIFQLPELEVLDLSYNLFEGTISEIHLSELHKLKSLDLSFNSLVLNLSPDWVPPFQLDYLSTAGCEMGHGFPIWIQSQSNISHLDLSSSGLSDAAPSWLWNDLSPQVTYLNLSHNQLTGSVPDLSSGDRIDISSNNFSGHVPLFPSNFRSIRLSRNMFSGSIQSICRTKYDRLGVLDLSNNQFSGELPDCWENMTDLMMLNLADNRFSGHLPRSLGSLIYLRVLHFRNNNFTGEFLPLNKCRFLQFIDGGENKLTGNLPTWIGLLEDLGFLILRQNNFHGSITEELCNLAFLQVLDLSQNYISGRIPQCFENFTSLVSDVPTSGAPLFLVGSGDGNFYGLGSYINDALVQWKRQESEYTNTLGLLKLIDLSSNKFEGNIPHGVFHLSRLVSLNLSHNYLTGNIDPDVGQMMMLECLDLRGNNLSGEISVGLAELHYLSVLDLSSNNFSGKIPEGTQLQSFEASAYTGNRELCGPPLSYCPGDEPRTPDAGQGNQVDVDQQGDQGFGNTSLFHDFWISAIPGYVVGFWVVIGPLLYKSSWRNAYFGYLSKIGDWLYVTITMCNEGQKVAFLDRCNHIFLYSRFVCD